MLIFQLPDNVDLRFTDRVLHIFYKHRQFRFYRHESGGIILGQIFDDFILADYVTTPGDGDRRGFFFFHRSQKRAQRIIDEKFIRTAGHRTFLGEWHTHRNSPPSPSRQDLSEAHRIFKKSILSLDYIIEVVVGNGNYVGDLWVGCVDDNRVIKCPRK